MPIRHFHVSHNTLCLRVSCPPTHANSFAYALSSSSLGIFNRPERNVDNNCACWGHATRKQSVLREMWKWRTVSQPIKTLFWTLRIEHNAGTWLATLLRRHPLSAKNKNRGNKRHLPTQFLQLIGQSGKYHNIPYIPVWVVLHMNPSFAICFVLGTICTCTASALGKVAYTARALHVQFV